MKLESKGILIGLKPLNERDVVATIFSYEHGLVRGLMRGAQIAKKNRPLVGQTGDMIWNARLDSQLGVFHWDAEKNMVANLMQNPKLLAYMNSAMAIISDLLPEREDYKELYDDTINLLNNLAFDGGDAYLKWEISLLRQLGYALDLSSCSGCGSIDDLKYLSPRTGRAVCMNCATPYINKLYKLPLNLDITLRFLENVCMQQGIRVPLMREMLKKQFDT